MPVTPQMNPNILAIGGDLSMMVAPTDEQAIERLGQGRRLLRVRHHALLHDRHAHTWADRSVEAASRRDREGSRRIVYGPGRGPIGSPATVREFLRGYEESGVDELILLLTPRRHEETMESIELMGKRRAARVHRTPREGGRREGQAARTDPREGRGSQAGVEGARRSTRPTRSAACRPAAENYTANEVSLAMDEMNAGIEAGGGEAEVGEGWDSRNRPPTR